MEQLAYVSIPPQNAIRPVLQTRHLGQRLDLLSVTGNGIEQQVGSAHGHYLFELFPHLLRRAEHSSRGRQVWFMVHHAKPTMYLGLGRLRALMHRHEYPLGNRECRRVAPSDFQRCPDQWHTLREGSRGGAASAHPAISDSRSPLERVGVATAQPHRWVRLLHGLWPHHTILKLKNLTPIGHSGLGPQRFHQFHFLQKPPYTAFSGDLELLVMLLPAQPDPQYCPTAAQVVQGSHLVRHVDRVVHGQHQHRHPQTDGAGERRGIGQERERVKAVGVVQCIVGDPQVVEPQGFSTLRDLAYHRRPNGIRRTMRQGHTERDLVFQGHACVSSREKRWLRRRRQEPTATAP